MDGFRWIYSPLLLIAGLFKRTPKITRAEVEARVDEWGVDWLGTHKREAVDDIMWMIERS